MPAMHARPGGQSTPHAPQLVASLESVEHTGPMTPMHICRGGAHGPSQAPITQADPGGHRSAQPPQLFASDNWFVQTGFIDPG